VAVDDFIWQPQMMGKWHRWVGVIADAEGDVSQFSVRYEYLLLARPAKARR